MILTWLFWIATAHGQTKDLERVYFERLSHASAAEITDLKMTFEKIKTWRLACELQTREARVPVSCYQQLAAETKWQLWSAEAARTRAATLDQRCARAAQNLRLPPEATDMNAVSESCREAIVRARAIERYRSEDP